MNLRLAPVQQHVFAERLDDVRAEVLKQLRTLPLSECVSPGMHVAVGVGSRGISCLIDVVRAVITELQRLGAQPYLVPAMGSHGGGTAEGQRAILEGYGLQPETHGVPIRSTMDTVVAGETLEGMPVFFDRAAANGDGIIIINRVKEHPAFTGPWESGLLKMLAVGLGKAQGAAEIHKWGLRTAMPAAARVILARMPVLAGVAIVENGNHEPARIAVLPAKQIGAEERILLELARKWTPRIPFEPIDLLVVQEMGKDISGTGMDLTVIGMWRRNGGPVQPDIRSIAVLDLTEHSQGNASGVGHADLIPQRLRDKINQVATYKNCLTSRNLAGAKIPMTLATDREVIAAGITSSPARVVFIRNTLELEHLWVAEPLLETAATTSTLEVVGSLRPLKFDKAGNLIGPKWPE